MKKLALLAIIILSGCSVTTLRCGIADDESYVELINLPQDISAQARHFTDLCGFAYEVEPVKLNILEAQ